MNIGIFDTEHFETTYTLIRLFDLPENIITIYTDTHCKQRLGEYKDFDSSKYRWHLKDSGESHAAFISRTGKHISGTKTQLMFYNTISNNHLLHALQIRNSRVPRTILTIHDVNDMTEFTFQIGLKSIVRQVGKLMLIRTVKELNVISDTMINTLVQRTGGNHIIHNIPGSVFEPPAPVARLTGKMKIVVPGTIDRKRKDYFEALKLLVNADAAGLQVEMTFAGVPYGWYGRQIAELSNRLHLKHSSLVMFETELSHQKFDEIIRDAHFIYIPTVRISKPPGQRKEIYGITKSSGAIFDALRHARPMIIPSRLQMSTKLEKCCMRYRDIDHLLSLLRELTTHPNQYIAWQENALQCAEHYTIDNTRKLNPSLFSTTSDP
jgi:hypothetical protein